MALGGSKGIGKQIAAELVKQGCAVSLIARNRNNLEKARSELLSLSKCSGKEVDVECYAVDLTQNFETVTYFLLNLKFRLLHQNFFLLFVYG